MFHKLHSSGHRGLQFDNRLKTILEGLDKSDEAIAHAAGQRALKNPLVLLEGDDVVTVVDFERREKVARSFIALESEAPTLPGSTDNTMQYDPQYFRNLRFVHVGASANPRQEAIGEA